MCDAARFGVQLRAAERFRVNDLAGRAFDEVRAAQAHEARLLDHDQNVAQRRKIGAAGDARSHDGGKLRHPELAPHKRIIQKNAARAVLAGKDAVLIRKVDAGGIHQIDDGRAVAHGDFLRAQNLGDGLGPPGAGFDGGVVSDNDGGTTFDFADARDDAGGRRLPLVLVVSDQQSDFEETRAGIEQLRDALTCRELAGLVLALDFRNPAAPAQAIFEFVELLDQMAHVCGTGEGGGSSRRVWGGHKNIVSWEDSGPVQHADQVYDAASSFFGKINDERRGDMESQLSLSSKVLRPTCRAVSHAVLIPAVRVKLFCDGGKCRMHSDLFCKRTNEAGKHFPFLTGQDTSSALQGTNSVFDAILGIGRHCSEM